MNVLSDVTRDANKCRQALGSVPSPIAARCTRLPLRWGTVGEARPGTDRRLTAGFEREAHRETPVAHGFPPKSTICTVSWDFRSDFSDRRVTAVRSHTGHPADGFARSGTSCRRPAAAITAGSTVPLIDRPSGQCSGRCWQGVQVLAAVGALEDAAGPSRRRACSACWGRWRAPEPECLVRPVLTGLQLPPLSVLLKTPPLSVPA